MNTGKISHEHELVCFIRVSNLDVILGYILECFSLYNGSFIPKLHAKWHCTLPTLLMSCLVYGDHILD